MTFTNDEGEQEWNDLAEFIECYNPGNRHQRKATWHPETNPEGRWRSYSYAELIARDKTSLDLFWLKDRGLADFDNLPEPEDIATCGLVTAEVGRGIRHPNTLRRYVESWALMCYIKTSQTVWQKTFEPRFVS